MTRLINKWMMGSLNTLFSVGILAIIIIQNENKFIGVFDLKWLLLLCLQAIIVFWLSYFSLGDRRGIRMTIRALAIATPILALILFQIYKPAYDVRTAITTIEQKSGYKNVQLNKEYHLMSFSPRGNWFVSTGYVFEAEKDEQHHTLIFNPVTGQFDPIEQG